MKRRILSIITALALCLSLCPTWALAAEADPSLCKHHPEHTTDCGYAAPTEGHDCGHQHTAECYTLGVLPDADGGDPYEVGADTENLLNCQHSHDSECGYVEADPGAPCGYVCHICPIEDLIAALPEQVTEDNADDVRAQLDHILDLYRELDEGEQEEIDLSRVTKLQEALDVANAPMQAAGEINISQNSQNKLTEEDGDCPGHTFTGTAQTAMIYVESGAHNVTFSRLNITGTAYVGIAPGATMNLTLEDSNTIKGFECGIYVPKGATLVTTAESAGSLDVSGPYSAGIGGSLYDLNSNDGDIDCGTVIINGGNITATGGSAGYASAGIGGAAGDNTNDGNGGNITINGGKVTAKGGYDGVSNAPGIGGSTSAKSDGTLTISSADVLDGNTTLGAKGTYTITGDPTADMIVVPELVYTGEVLDTSGIKIDDSKTGTGTYFGQTFTVNASADGWTYTIDPAVVKAAGDYTVTFSKEGHTSISKTFTVAQSGTQFVGDGEVKTYNGDTLTTSFSAGDTITVKATPTATGKAPDNSAMFAASFTAPTAGQMAVFVGDTQVSAPVGAVDGSYTMTVSAADVLLAAGGPGTEIPLTARFTANDNMADGAGTVTVNITAAAKAELDGKVIGYYGESNLDKAFANDGATVTLLDNITTSTHIGVDTGNLTLDLNGKTITKPASYGVYVSGSGHLTIRGNGKIICTGTSGHYPEAITSVGGTLTLEGGTFIGLMYGVRVDWETSVLSVTGESVSIQGEQYGLRVSQAQSVQLSAGTYSSISVYTFNTLARLLAENCAYYKGSTPVPLSELEGKTELTGPVTVRECQHKDVTPTANNDGTHTLTCPYCGYHSEHTTALTATASGNTVTLNGGCESCDYRAETLATAAFTIPKLTYGQTDQTVNCTWEHPNGYALMVQIDSGEELQLESSDTQVSLPLKQLFGSQEINAGNYQLHVYCRSYADVTSNVCSLPVTVDPAPLPEVTLSAESATYSGTEQKPALSVQQGETALTEGTDYEVSYTRDGVVTNDFTSAGTVNITVTGKENYTGSVEKTYTIGKATPKIEWANSQVELTYTGQPADIKPVITLVNGEEYKGEIHYSWGVVVDSLVPPTDAQNVSIMASIPEQGNYLAAESGWLILYINKANQDAPDAPTADGENIKDTSITLNTIENAEYSKDGTTWQDSPAFTGLDPNRAYTFYARLKEDRNHNASPSSAAASIATKKTMLDTAVVTVSGTYTYTGAAIVPETGNVEVVLNGTKIDSDQYTISASNNTNAGVGKATLTVTATETGNYSGSVSTTFTINRADLTVKANDQTITYGGSITQGTGQVTSEGLCGGDTLESVTLTPSSDQVAVAGKTITPSAAVIKRGSEVVTANYDITYETGALTINKDTSAEAPKAGEGYELDYAQETIIVKKGYEVSTAQDGGVAVPSGSITDHLGQTLYIRKVEDDNHAASGWAEIAVAARPNPPALEAVGETLKGKSDGQLTGDGTGTEYSTDGGTTWKDYADGAFTGLAGGTTFQVRVKAIKESAPHGNVSSYSIAEGKTITVTFDSQGGSAVAAQSGLSYEATVNRPDPPTRTDYEFLGWYTAADGTTEWNFAADKVTAENVTIYAKWKQVNFQVGGTVKDSTGTTVISGATVTLKQGKRQIDQGTTGSDGTFAFSKTIPAGAYNIVTTYTPEGKAEQTNTTLITITDSDMSNVEVKLPPEGVNSELEVKPNTPAVVVGGLDEEAAAQKEEGKTVTVNMTVEGKEETAVPAEQVSAIKEAAGNSGTSDPVVEYLDVSITKQVDEKKETVTETKNVIEIVVPFDFSGKDANKIIVLRYHGSSAAALDKLSSKPTSGYTDGKVYLDTANGLLYIYSTQFSTYAVAYEVTRYTITFNASGGAVSPENSMTGSNGTLSTLPTPSRSGYSFTGWYTAASGGTQVTTATVFTKNTTIYAHWQQNTPVDPTIPVTGISLDKSGLTLTAGQTERLTATVRPSNATNKSVVWSTSDLSVAAVDISGNVTARAPGTAVITVATRSGSHKATCTVTVVGASYTVTYSSNGGTGTMTAGTALSGTAFVLPECGFTAPKGKEFDAWAIGSVSGEKAAAGSSHTFTADTTVYALWKDAAAESYTITYHANGGAGTMAGSTVRKGTAFTLPGCGFTPPVGKVFDAWAINSSSGERVEAGSAQTFTADAVLYALWKDAPAVTYTIVYSANGGTGTMADGIAPDGEPFVLPECGFTAPEGKTFAGWSIGGTVVAAGGSYTFTSDTTVLAIWKDAEAVTYRVTFLPNGGTGTAPVIADTAEGSTFRLPANPFSREGYQFTGWRCGGAVYQPGDMFTMPDHDVTFSAQWNPIAYAITGRVLQKGVGVPGVTVRLMLGSTEIARCVTGEGGRFAFEDVSFGIYNLVAEKDGITKTVMQEITNSSAEITIELPLGKTNSVVEIKDKDTPPVVVGGLENIFQDDTLYTNEDKEIVAAGGTVEFKMEVGKRDTLPEGTVIEAIKPSGQIWGLFLDLSITKTVTRLDGTETSSPVTEVGTLITTRIPLPVELQGKDHYAVYRVHGGTAEVLPNGGSGERYEVSPDKTVITIFAQKYSTYAIAWSSETPPMPPVNPSWPTGGSSGGSSVKTYAITVEKSEHGIVTANHTNAASGTTVTLTVTPDTGYVLLDLAVTDSQGSQINLTDKNTFTMPARAVTVKASFAPLPDESQEQPCDGGADCPSRSFTDLGAVGTWYHEAVDYVLRNGLMNGHDNGLFGPDDGLTRAQLAQILHNLKGRPVVNYLLQFEDVPSGAWYTEAVRWAASTGIVGGYGNGLFGPDDKITREQLAVMLWRYAGSPAATDKELHFSDANQASSWALDALRWAVENGIISGKGGGILDPTGPATRAEAAEMLKNFLENQ